jgi:CelD/BcsL family acetyltransferase involved in cellulose biosynthesis
VTDLKVETHSEISNIPMGAWATLVARAPASIAGSRAWVQAALATVDRETEPHLLTVWADDCMVALMALVVDRRPRPTLRFAAAPFNDLTDLMVLPGHETPAAAAVIDVLREISGRGWLIELEDLDPAGALAAGDRGQDLLQWEPSWVAPTLPLDEGHAWRVSPRLRRRWDRDVQRLSSQHRVEVRFVTGPSVLEDFVEFVRVRDVRLRAKGRNLRDPPPELLEAAVQRLAPLEHCAFMELHVGDVVVARDLYLLGGSVGMLWLRALDMGWLPYSCGHILLRASTELLASKGFDTIDFGRGAEHYKFAFGAQERVLLTARIPIAGQ